MTIFDYLVKRGNLANQCAAAGYIVEDEDLVMYALASLGSDYYPIICSITTRSSEKKLALKEVYFLLLNHESRIKRNIATMEINNSSANFVKHSLENRGHGRGPPSRSCGRGRSNGPGRGGNGSKPIYKICGKAGHTTLNCWYNGTSLLSTRFETLSLTNFSI